jgi:hypothetical protein
VLDDLDAVLLLELLGDVLALGVAVEDDAEDR